MKTFWYTLKPIREGMVERILNSNMDDNKYIAYDEW